MADTHFKLAFQLKPGDVFLTNGVYTNSLTPWRMVDRIDSLPGRMIGVMLDGQSKRYDIRKDDFVEVMS